MKGTHLLLIVNTCWKMGVPPEKCGVLYPLLHIEFHSSNSWISVLGLSYFGPGINSNFGSPMGSLCHILGVVCHPLYIVCHLCPP